MVWFAHKICWVLTGLGCACRGKAIAIDIVKGLSFMHRNHIIHFDIKR